MNIPHQSFTTWKAIVTVLQLFAILVTMLRLAFRHRRCTIWVDDVTVIPPLIMELAAAVVVWFLYVDPESTTTVKNEVALYWLASISWLTILWLTRISLILSITRIFPVWGTIRRNCRGISIAFGIFYVGFMCWLCTSPCVPSASVGPALQSDILDCSNERHFLAIACFAGTSNVTSTPQIPYLTIHS
ncbi:hypothetical protein CVT25_011894 [Psilocybe cyanescens]|uniref:Rhodopsin domain-containing protein n=1 Tax=Psilocybe cyanescens TaxID=93625 RepID=A0A409WIV0_PSICY|nr:hypothetical protein CVT25_011894 [Psilocybe cyanescens]